MSESGQNFLAGVGHSVKALEEELTNAGQKVSGRIVESLEHISNGNSSYREQLEKLNKNMAALNTAHELHLQETTQRLKEAEKVYAGVDGMIKNLNTTMAETEKFTGAVEVLNRNIASLNTVYGNMLSAINAMSNGK